jgi:hypothetical protein
MYYLFSKHARWLTVASVCAAVYGLFLVGTQFSQQKIVLGAISGDGSTDSPYLISTCAELSEFSDLVNAVDTGPVDYHARIIDNLECTGVDIDPIAMNEDYPYAGVFDGGGFQIMDLRMDYADDIATTTFATDPATNQKNVGLFGVVDGGAIQNVILQNAFIKGYENVGGIVGYMVTGTIHRSSVNIGVVPGVDSDVCSEDSCVWARYGLYGGGIVGRMDGGTLTHVTVEGSVKGSGNHIGGIVGDMNGGSIQYAVVDARVDGGRNIGGIVGRITGNSEITQSQVNGNVQGYFESSFKDGENIGGLVGYVDRTILDGVIRISNSYADAFVGGKTNIGGVIGQINLSNDGVEITNVYAAGQVSIVSSTSNGSSFIGNILNGGGNSVIIDNSFTVSQFNNAISSSPFVGSIVGNMENNSNITPANVYFDSSLTVVSNCAYLTDTSTTTDSGCIDSESSNFRSEIELPTSVWNDDDFIWTFNNSNYPTLFIPPFLEGYGTPENPFIINSCEELQAISTELGLEYHYELFGDIDCTSVSISDEKGFTPIGSDSAPFTGGLDGDGHTISNVVINVANTSNIGIFGYVSEATIENLTISVSSITSAGSTIGSLAGYITSSTLSNIEVIDSTIQGVNDGIDGDSYLGGLVGHVDNSTLDGITVDTTTVLGESEVGGIAGRVSDSTISSSTVIDGNVSLFDITNFANPPISVGGAIGELLSSEVTGLSFIGEVTGHSHVGGLIGTVSESTISESYASSTITGTKNVGGLIGTLQKNNSIQQTYNVSNIDFFVPEIDSVLGEYVVGGHIGLIEGRDNAISNSFSQTNIVDNSETPIPPDPDPNLIIGGFVGRINSNTSIITNSYASGNIDGRNSGGFVGYLAPGSISMGPGMSIESPVDYVISNAFSAILFTDSAGGFVYNNGGFNDNTITGPVYFDSALGENTACEYTDAETTSTFANCIPVDTTVSTTYFYDGTNDVFDGWDFPSVWLERLDENDIPNDYPVLAGLPAPERSVAPDAPTDGGGGDEGGGDGGGDGGDEGGDGEEPAPEEEEEEERPRRSGGGGGFMPPASPTLPSGVSAMDGALVINNGAAQTSNREVTLQIRASQVQSMAISNSADFSASSFVPYSETTKHMLSEGFGAKQVYVKLRTASGGTLTITDSIQFVAQTTVTAPAAPVVQQSSSCALTPGRAYAVAGNATVYYVSPSCVRYTFRTPAQYFSYFDAWSQVERVDSATLNRVSLTTSPVPWGPKYRPTGVTYLRAVDGADTSVYVVLYNKKHAVSSDTLFTTMGYNLSWIEPASAALIASLERGIDFTRTDIHPDFTLIQFTDSPRIYRLESDAAGRHVKRWIVSEAAFNRNGFRWDRIVRVNRPTYHQFPDGANIE